MLKPCYFRISLPCLLTAAIIAVPLNPVRRAAASTQALPGRISDLAQGTGCSYSKNGIWCGGERLDIDTDRVVSTLAISLCYTQLGRLSEEESIQAGLQFLRSKGIDHSRFKAITTAWRARDPYLVDKAIKYNGGCEAYLKRLGTQSQRTP